MKSNFSFLKENKEYELFADACIDAENVASSAPALSVSGSRKALELAVKWLYAADEFLQLPSGRYTLQDLLHDPAFQDEVDAEIRSHMQYIVRMGNYGIHTGNKYTKGDSRSYRMSIRRICLIMCAVAEGYYNENKEKFYFNYEILDWDKATEHLPPIDMEAVMKALADPNLGE